MRFLLRRFIRGILFLVGVSMLSFVFLQLAPGDFLDEMRLNPQISAQTLAALRNQYGLDRSPPQRYLDWLNSLWKGDLGFSFAYNCPVGDLLWPRALNTLLLTVTGTAIAWLIAVPLGVWSAANRGRWLDRFCTVITSSLLAIPDILLALGFLFLAVRTGWLPIGGMLSAGYSAMNLWAKAADILAHFFLPVLILVLGSLPVLLRHVRAAMIEVLSCPFIRAARAHGIPRRSLLFHYGLRAAANPLASLLGLSLTLLLSGSLLVEIILGWPGIGPLLLNAILGRDVYVIIGAVMVSTLIIFAANLAGDAMLYTLDPRIRTG